MGLTVNRQKYFYQANINRQISFTNNLHGVKFAVYMFIH